MRAAWKGWQGNLRDGVSRAGAAIDEVVNEDRIRLAVTGLSRAGKTVFITALIRNLLALGAGRNTLPALHARLSENGATRLRGVHVLPAGAAVLPYFDHASKLASLAAEQPAWPPRTDDVAQVSLALCLMRKSALGQRLGSRRVRLDILDYPGEWLLDLPLLEQSFAAWSADTLRLLRQTPRREVSTAFLNFAAGLRPGDKADETVARRGHELYRATLAACRTDLGLPYLQPGRFLCPGHRGDLPFMWFFPLAVPPGAPGAPGTLAALLSARFEAYKRDSHVSFLEPYCSAFDRQVVLVDVLGALYAGRAAFEDTAQAIQDIARALRYGSGGPGLWRGVAAGALRGSNHLLPAAIGRASVAAARRLAARRIERVVFAATKADHVPPLKREHLRSLLRSLLETAAVPQRLAGASVSYQVTASLVATEDGIAKVDGRPVEVVRGIKLGEDKLRSFYVGEVPARTPPASFWTEPFFELPQFRPPPVDPGGAAGVPHLGLDLILDDLIGDLL